MTDVVKKKSSRDRIIAAALVCFEKYGITKTTMNDVTSQANLGRMTVYRYFPTRTSLLKEIALIKMREFVVALDSLISCETSFEEAFITITLKSVEMGRSDPIFVSLLENTGDSLDSNGTVRFIIENNSESAEIMRAIWKKALHQARKKGQLRSELDDEKLMTWFRDVQYLMLLRNDLNHKGQEELLRSFVLPAILVNFRIPDDRNLNP